MAKMHNHKLSPAISYCEQFIPIGTTYNQFKINDMS